MKHDFEKTFTHMVADVESVSGNPGNETITLNIESGDYVDIKDEIDRTKVEVFSKGDVIVIDELYFHTDKDQVDVIKQIFREVSSVDGNIVNLSKKEGAVVDIGKMEKGDRLLRIEKKE